MNARQDLAVILARGESRRMGEPKGLVPWPGGNHDTMAAAVATLYDEAGMPSVLVTTKGLAPDYRRALAGITSCRVVTGTAGGETARTVWLGWQAGVDAVTHVWAHPVDLPLVDAGTLHALWAASRSSPQRVLRPAFRGRAGHPLVVPVAALARLEESDCWELPMRQVLEQAVASGLIDKVGLLETDDQGVVEDFDTPDDLAQL